MNNTLWMWLLLWGSAVAQDDLPDRALRYWRNEELDSLRAILPVLYQQHEHSSAATFFRAAMDSRAEAAVEEFHKLAAGSDGFAEESLIRWIQFEYAVGRYVSAKEKWHDLRNRFPSSRWVSVGKEMLGRIEPDTTSGAAFVLQVGAFSVMDNARDLQKKVSDAGYAPVRIQEKTVQGKKLFAVWVGGYPTRSSADATGKRIQSELGLSYSIVQP